MESSQHSCVRLNPDLPCSVYAHVTLGVQWPTTGNRFRPRHALDSPPGHAVIDGWETGLLLVVCPSNSASASHSHSKRRSGQRPAHCSTAHMHTPEGPPARGIQGLELLARVLQVAPQALAQLVQACARGCRGCSSLMGGALHLQRMGGWGVVQAVEGDGGESEGGRRGLRHRARVRA